MSEFNTKSPAESSTLSPHVQPGSEFPDYCEPILAWRFWRVSADGDLLLSFIDSKWTPYEPFIAEHKKDAMGTLTYRALLSAMGGGPALECTSVPCSYHKPGYVYGCGVYGLKGQQQFQDKMKREFEKFYHCFNQSTIVRLFGSVWLWGRIWEHERGYRAQYAYPASFTYGYNCDAAKLASIYGIPYNEDQSWKSVFQSVTSSRSPYDYPSLSAQLHSHPKFPSLLQSAYRHSPRYPLQSSSQRNWANPLYVPKMQAWYDEKEEVAAIKNNRVWFDQKDKDEKPLLSAGWNDPSDDKPPTKD